MKVAALDLGTNTFLCLIAEIENGVFTKIVDDQYRFVKLGQGVHETRQFQPEALKRAEDCLAEFAQIIKRHQPQRVLAMATSAARDVTNSSLLFELGRKYQIPIEIIPGEKEAEISYRGAISGLPEQGLNRVILDIGGGSTEFVLGRGPDVLFSNSVDVGSVRLTEMFFKKQPSSPENLHNFERYVEESFAETVRKILSIADLDEVLAVAGTPTELARIEIGDFDVQRIEGFIFDQKKLNSICAEFALCSVLQLHEVHGVHQGRAEVITAGAFILKKACEMLGKNQLRVSTRGVRFGIALELASRVG